MQEPAEPLPNPGSRRRLSVHFADDVKSAEDEGPGPAGNNSHFPTLFELFSSSSESPQNLNLSSSAEEEEEEFPFASILPFSSSSSSDEASQDSNPLSSADQDYAASVLLPTTSFVTYSSSSSDESSYDSSQPLNHHYSEESPQHLNLPSMSLNDDTNMPETMEASNEQSAEFAGGEMHPLVHGHRDVITCLRYNFYGTRLLTASADHHIHVYRPNSNGVWIRQTRWRAHDAEVIDAQWASPHVGQIIGSVGEDQQFNLWEEDPTRAQGQTWVHVYTIQARGFPFVSMDFKTIKYGDLHLALLSRDGQLTVYEPSEPDILTSWTVVDQFFVCTQPPRGTETAFKVMFDPNPLPCWKACVAGLREDALSLVTAGMDTVKVWRTDSTGRFYLAADLSGHHHGLVRSVDWAQMNVRGWDLIASTCKDGFIRVFEVRTDEAAAASTEAESAGPAGSSRAHQERPAGYSASGIGAGLTGLSGGSRTDPDEAVEGRVFHTVKQTGAMSDEYGGLWSVKWRVVPGSGMELLSSHDDGTLHVWKLNVEGQWEEYVEVDLTEDTSDEDEEKEGDGEEGDE